MLLTDLTDVVSVALTLSFVAERLTEYLIVPIFEKVNAAVGTTILDKAFWIKYVVLLIGGLLSYFANVNFFAAVFAQPLVGIILSAAVVGCGSEFVHQAIGALNRTNRG
jgi:hypothetical protein